MSGGFTCVSCGGTTARDWRVEGGWKIIRCKGCGLAATWPRPDATTLAGLYESESYWREWSMDEAVPEAWETRARGILDALPEIQGPVLDLGAGSGGFVHGARAMGIEADGVEPSTIGRTLARRLYGIELMPRVENASDRRYAAITLIHVLEHVPDPRADLEALGSMLTPNGVVFIEVPHAGSAEMWLRSRRRVILQPPAHLHHFTPKTLHALLENASYDVLGERLFNAAPVERALAWRAQHRGSHGRLGTSASSTASSGSSRFARTLGRRALAALQPVLAGYKFQVVARPIR
jgi:SAM-dependent methyltransferase